MNKRIEKINQQQLNSKKPVINKEKTHFEWEDTSLLPLLCDGLSTLYPRNVSKENWTAEKEAIDIANELISETNKGLDYSKFEDNFNSIIASHDGYVRGRLEELKFLLIDNVKARKGLLLHGEGGIGKTYFAYELAQKLKTKQRSFVITFNQEGVVRLGELGFESLKKSYPNGFTMILDACNELDDDGFELAYELITKALKADNVNVIMTTRSESPTSRLSELEELLPTSIKFRGVNPDLVFSVLAECADEIIIQYQDMLFSRNPRNLNAMLAKIKNLRPGEDGRSATTQRTALVEKCIKDSLSKKQWVQTKNICKFLLDAGELGFTKENAEIILGQEADVYLASMIEQGFIESYDYNGPRYYYSSESQIRCLIARCLNDTFSELSDHCSSEDELIDSIARLVKEKSYCSNDHEMIQVAIDRYLNRGPDFFIRLLERFIQFGLVPDRERLLTQTIFPLDWDFRSLVDAYRVDTKWAFMYCSGILNTPYNLANYTNEFFKADESLVENFFTVNWNRWQIAPIMSRVQNITDFVSRTSRVPAAAEIEWVWLSVWCSFSSDITLRALSQRLMFFGLWLMERA